MHASLCMCMYTSIKENVNLCTQTHKYLHIAHTHTYIHTSRNTGKVGASNPRQDGKLTGAAGPLSPCQPRDARINIGKQTKCRASPRSLILTRSKVVTF